MQKDPSCSLLVVKIASRCNLNCSYCYMYSFGDQTYLKQPKFMSYQTVSKLMDKVRLHSIKHNLQKFYFVFHGGEPLLAASEFFIHFIGEAHRIIGRKVKLYFSVQTNGTLLTDEWCKMFAEYNVRIGVSIDGPKDVHDMHRLDHKGHGSFTDVLRGIEAVKRNGLKDTSKLLCVINANADPIQTYNFFKSTEIRNIDFLLPDLNYNHLQTISTDFKVDRYAEWLIAVFDQWMVDSRSSRPINIRRFDTAIQLILGKSTQSDEMGGAENPVLVIETDGGIEAVDSLKICGDGFTKAGLSVFRDTLDDALKSDLASKYYNSHTNLCNKCKDCDLKEVCGGGNIVHRYSSLNGFDNPSIYCVSLEKLYRHIRRSLVKVFEKYNLEVA